VTIIATRTPDANVSFVSMLKHAVVDAQGKPLGRVVDAIVRPSDDYYPLLVGLVTGGGGGETCIPVGDVGSIGSEVIRVGDTPGSSSQFEPRESDIFLRKDVLGHRLLDIEHSALVRAYDVRLASTPEGWAAIGLDVHKHRWFHFGDHESHSARDWNGFLLLIGRQAALKNRFSNRVRSLKPAQLADIIESASSEEQGLLLGQLHADPELEADVFEELDEDKQSQLLKTRSDQDVATRSWSFPRCGAEESLTCSPNRKAPRYSLCSATTPQQPAASWAPTSLHCPKINASPTHLSNFERLPPNSLRR